MVGVPITPTTVIGTPDTILCYWHLTTGTKAYPIALPWAICFVTLNFFMLNTV